MIEAMLGDAFRAIRHHPKISRAIAAALAIPSLLFGGDRVLNFGAECNIAAAHNAAYGRSPEFLKYDQNTLNVVATLTKTTKIERLPSGYYQLSPSCRYLLSDNFIEHYSRLLEDDFEESMLKGSGL